LRTTGSRGWFKHEQALAGARSVTQRQAEAVRLLEDGGIRHLVALWQLDITCDPGSMRGL